MANGDVDKIRDIAIDGLVEKFGAVIEDLAQMTGQQQSLSPNASRLWCEAMLDRFSGYRERPVLNRFCDAGEFPSRVAFEVPFESICGFHLMPFSGSLLIVYQPGLRLVMVDQVVACVSSLASMAQTFEGLAQSTLCLFEPVEHEGMAVVAKGSSSCALCGPLSSVWAHSNGADLLSALV